MALTDGIVSYWKLDESSGNATDSHGPNNLANSGVTYQAGKINNGALFDSGSDTLLITDGAQSGLDFSTEFTISCWVKFNSLPVYGASESWLVSKWQNPPAGSASYCLSLEAHPITYGDYMITIGTSTDGNSIRNASYGKTSYNTGLWYHIVAVYDSGAISVYRDNVALSVQVGSAVFYPIRNGAASFRVGCGYLGSALRLDGMMDEVGVWGRALTIQEVSKLYNNGTGLQYPFVRPASMFPGATQQLTL
jgi:hypothetical protein